MEEVPGSCWARVYGVIGIPGSWQLLVLSLSLFLSLSIYCTTISFFLSSLPSHSLLRT
jgi:hypothetical protein